jgi:lipopolysaccharide cholinephosphotransferase
MAQLNQYSQQFFGGGLSVDPTKPLHIQLCRIADQIAMLGNGKAAQYFDYYPRMVIQEEPHLRTHELYDDLVDWPFEMTSVRGPREIHEALLIMYGEDYMTPVMFASEHEYPFYKNQVEYFRLACYEMEL